MAPKVERGTPPPPRDVRAPAVEPQGREAALPPGVTPAPLRRSSARDAADLEKIAGTVAGRVGNVLGRGSVGGKVTVAGVSDTVAGHLGRTLDEMDPPPLGVLEGVLRSVG